ncbi:MAG: hypothetical protein ABI321_12295 [Polyangia bacterium]
MRVLLILGLALCASACAPGAATTSDGDGTSDALRTLRPSTVSQGVDALYVDADNWQRVADDAYAYLASFGLDGPTSPACATFLSYALIDLGGVTLPDTKYEGYALRINTTSLSDYLRHELGWQYIGKHTSLTSGDAVFTRPATAGSSHPAHVYMFHEWIDAQYAWITDNQSSTYCDPDAVEFVGYCDDVDGQPLCCRGPGLRQWKRSVTVDYPHDASDGTPDTDQRMWFGLRAPK